MRSPGYVLSIEWISKAWVAMDEEIIRRSFEVCGITSKDDLHSSLNAILATGKAINTYITEAVEEDAMDGFDGLEEGELCSEGAGYHVDSEAEPEEQDEPLDGENLADEAMMTLHSNTNRSTRANEPTRASLDQNSLIGAAQGKNSNRDARRIYSTTGQLQASTSTSRVAGGATVGQKNNGNQVRGKLQRKGQKRARSKVRAVNGGGVNGRAGQGSGKGRGRGRGRGKGRGGQGGQRGRGGHRGKGKSRDGGQQRNEN
jgi:hypothetical protein